MDNQPLTELEIIEHFGYSLPSEDIDRDYLAETYRVLRRYKRAYAAQQNAELVAENECLREQNLAMIDGVDELQAENERLKQQLADFRSAAQKALSQPAEYMDLVNMFHDTQPPKEAT